MSDPAKIRLVRCPKCENLLPELEGYSVYQCGGCGAVLRASKGNPEMGLLSHKLDDERVQVAEDNIPKKLDSYNFHEEKGNSKEGLDSDDRSDGSSSRGNEKLKAEKMVVDEELERTETSPGFAHAEMPREYRDLGPSNGNIIGSQISESFADWRGIGGRTLEGVVGHRKQDLHALRYSTSIYREDGPSNYPLRPSYGYGEQINCRNVADELSKVKYLEKDRAELLKKLDELKDQISRSCDINDKPKENVLHNPMMTRQEVIYTDKPPYATQYNETSPCIGRQEMGMHGYCDNLSSQMLRSSHQEPNLYFPGHYVHNKMDPYQQPYSNDINHYHQQCSCVQCYNHYSRMVPSVPTNSFPNKTLPYEPYNPMLYRHENQRPLGLSDYNSKAMNANPLGNHDPQSHTRLRGDYNTYVPGYGSRGPPRVVMTTGKRRCHSIAGGSPMVSCYNCFQLLELPNKISPSNMNLIKVKCGACSAILLFAIVDKKLVSVDEGANMAPKKVVKNPSLSVRESDFHTQGRANQASTNFSSEDYDNSGYDFQFSDREGQGFGSNMPDYMRGFHSASSYTSEHEVSPDSMNPPEEGHNSAELEEKNILSLPLRGSPLEDHFDYSSKYRFETGNQNGSSKREQAELRKVPSRQDSMEDACLPTEMYVSFNEDIDNGISFETGETSKDEDQLRGSKGAQSFFAGIIKKNFKDFSKSSNVIDSSSNVIINGHPITNRLLKKAEKVAGPVHPGQYWYDFRAGFWGVMGGPCLGIIPPFIEEFNHPMPEKCAGGNTGVFVNGRELHKKDLNLLCSRGLPSTGDRSYIIEISGRVLDEDTGEELPGLGKLAPTVEKAKHGFGMKVPRLAA